MASTRKANRVRDDLMSLPKAAAALGETRLSVQSRILRGELAARQVDGRTFVSRDSIAALVAARVE